MERIAAKIKLFASDMKLNQTYLLKVYTKYCTKTMKFTYF
ncbi:hypothetical protein N499_1219 [Wolbachia pipientis wVitA]|nr:hypothetical protein N499_1219 [Wolbachia pipientis wVitA]